MSTPTLEPLSVEALQQVLTVDGDPTGTPPDFACLDCDEVPGAGSWTAGLWADAWSSTTLRVTAQTPTLSGIGYGATIELGDGDWRVWIRFTVGAETVVRELGRVRVRDTGVEGGGSGGGGTPVSEHSDVALGGIADGEGVVWNATAGQLEPAPLAGAGDMTAAVYDAASKAAQVATEAELTAHDVDTTDIHGIADTSDIVLVDGSRAMTDDLPLDSTPATTTGGLSTNANRGALTLHDGSQATFIYPAWTAAADPGATDDNFANSAQNHSFGTGSTWTNVTSDGFFVCVDGGSVGNDAVWRRVGLGSNIVDFSPTDSGWAVTNLGGKVRTIDVAATTLDVVADVLGSLVQQMLDYGVVDP